MGSNLVLLQVKTVTNCSSAIYARHEQMKLIPGRTETFWKEVNHVKGLWKNRQDLKVEDAGIAALFGLEVFCWFCAGEIVGRGFTFTGYNV
ncbi:hypothetical protein MKX03_019213 [Papaver bracteatum]|nr:hypothetical protein MKX03_019213 [Papaver bracteatum]